MTIKLRKPAVILKCAVITTAAVVALCSFTACAADSLSRKTAFYFVYCYETDGTAYASSLSEAVSSFGGAGYVLEYDGKYYVTAACYYSKNDALSVCDSLIRRGLSCGVVTAERNTFTLSTSAARNNAEKYLGNLNTLYEISTILYDCANGLDTGTYSSSSAKSVLRDVFGAINTLYSNNSSNCFTPFLSALYSLCEDCLYGGFIYSRDVRYIQIAAADTILSVTLT